MFFFGRRSEASLMPRVLYDPNSSFEGGTRWSAHFHMPVGRHGAPNPRAANHRCTCHSRVRAAVSGDRRCSRSTSCASSRAAAASRSSCSRTSRACSPTSSRSARTCSLTSRAARPTRAWSASRRASARGARRRFRTRRAPRASSVSRATTRASIGRASRATATAVSRKAPPRARAAGGTCTAAYASAGPGALFLPDSGRWPTALRQPTQKEDKMRALAAGAAASACGRAVARRARDGAVPLTCARAVPRAGRRVCHRRQEQRGDHRHAPRRALRRPRHAAGAPPPTTTHIHHP